MKPKARVSTGYLTLFAWLYAVQGVVIAYFFNFNFTYMTTAGVAKDTVAAVQSLALLPFVLKFLGGPLSDRVNFFGFGNRKPYVIMGLVVQSIGLLGLSWLNPGKSLTAFTTLAVLTVAGLSLYDTCCDGMVIDVTPPDDRSRVQGMLVAARALAAMACSLAFGFWLEGRGVGLVRFHHVLWSCAALGLVPLVLAVALREPQRARDDEPFHWEAFRVLLLPRSLALLAFGALYAVVGYGVEINLAPYYKSLNFGERAIGAFGSLRYVGRAVGAALLTVAMPRVARNRVLAIGILALAATTAGQGLIHGSLAAAFGGFAFGAANGWNDAVFFVLAMEASNPRMAASTYALFMAVTNASVGGGWLFSVLASALGNQDASAFGVSGAAVLIALLFVPALSRQAKKWEPLDELA